MITIKDFLKTCQYKITGGSVYQWKAFGENARYLDSDKDNTICSSIIFDSVTQEVYVAEVHTQTKAYRLVNPTYLKALKKEYKQRNLKFEEATESYDFTDLEVDEDWVEKASAILTGVEYDERIQVPLDLEYDEMYQLMQLAHKNDITLNEMVERVLRLAIEGKQLCQD